MNIRNVDKADAQMCGRILYDAFKNLAEQHNFPPDVPSAEVATGLASMLIGAPGFYGVVAEEANCRQQLHGRTLDYLWDRSDLCRS